MTGMKEGAGDDPFADDPTPDTDSNSDAAEPVEADNASAESAASSASESGQPMQIPYKFRRDGVQDGRDRVPLFLQPETKNAERDALRELEGRFNGNVSLTDLREALMIVGLDHLNEVETELEEWGYGMTFD
ncbi:hypothetical protein [Halarchaeum nitratireducens]|uniref:Uncharacterized protein n=1 Tax=Halarchaeum nitratireducens TaxID=489913 RepID=A0A830GES4_9EURY|nr:MULTISPECIES: hypothetical protein [Halarchaeum]MBP2252665.1 hypothetical protein [Halarchaeum solikamskense]GGN24230.1 hypothetical protein GCM10009021_27510 [Halarchaeum nitratireducens]